MQVGVTGLPVRNGKHLPDENAILKSAVEEIAT